MDLNVTPEISLSLFCVPDVTQRRKSYALKCDGSVMAVMMMARLAPGVGPRVNQGDCKMVGAKLRIFPRGGGI